MARRLLAIARAARRDAARSWRSCALSPRAAGGAVAARVAEPTPAADAAAGARPRRSTRPRIVWRRLASTRDADRRTAAQRGAAARARQALPHLGPGPQAQPEPLDAPQRHRRARPDAPAGRAASGASGEPLLIGDLSRPRGGDFGRRFGPIGHASHQNGLDADVYFPRKDGKPARAAEHRAGGPRAGPGTRRPLRASGREEDLRGRRPTAARPGGRRAAVAEPRRSSACASSEVRRAPCRRPRGRARPGRA